LQARRVGGGLPAWGYSVVSVFHRVGLAPAWPGVLGIDLVVGRRLGF